MKKLINKSETWRMFREHIVAAATETVMEKSSFSKMLW